MLPEQVEVAFLKKLEAEGLQKRLAACASPEEALEVVRAEGFDVPLQDFVESMQKLNSYVRPLASGGELSDNDLEYVAGGRSSDQTYKNTVIGVGTGAAVTGATVAVYAAVSAAAGAVA